MTIPRSVRLLEDYKAMQSIHGDLIRWTPGDGRNPPESYTVEYFLKGMVSEDTYIFHHIVEIKLTAEYPDKAPFAKFTSGVLYHPHVYNSGKICEGGYSADETLADFCLRIAKYIQFQPSIINLKSPANTAALNWFKQNKNKLPIDNSKLPDLDVTKTFSIKSSSHKKTFTPKQTRKK